MTAVRFVGVLALVGGLTVVGPPAGATPTCGGQPATIVGTPGDDVLQGTADPDVIAGLDGFDQIEGLGGDDLICGNEGTDSIRAGSGNDKVWGGPGNDDLYADTTSPPTDNDETYGGPGRDFIAYGFGSDRASGGPDADLLFFWGAADLGSDHVLGGDGDDSLGIGPSANVVYAGPGDDRLDAEIGTAEQYWDLGPGADGTFLLTNSTGDPATVNFRTGVVTVGGVVVVADIKGDEMRTLILGGWVGSWLVIGRDVAETVDGRPTEGVRFRGRGGADTLHGSAHDDVFAGGRGIDTGRLNGGTDTCRSVEHRFSCEIVS